MPDTYADLQIAVSYSTNPFEYHFLQCKKKKCLKKNGKIKRM